MRHQDQDFVFGLDDFLHRHVFDCVSNGGEAGRDAFHRIVAECEQRIVRARTAQSKQKYSNIVNFLLTFGKGNATYKRQVYSFCEDLVNGFSPKASAQLVSLKSGDETPKFQFNERELIKYIEQAQAGQSFGDMVNAFMIKKGLAPKDVYANARLSRQDFNRITTPGKGVKRPTVYSVAIGLRLTWTETQTLLRSAGYAYRSNSVSDAIIKYCISEKLYDVYTINELLYTYGQDTLADNYQKVSSKRAK